jgi:hypothetical protein
VRGATTAPSRITPLRVSFAVVWTPESTRIRVARASDLARCPRKAKTSGRLRDRSPARGPRRPRRGRALGPVSRRSRRLARCRAARPCGRRAGRR